MSLRDLSVPLRQRLIDPLWNRVREYRSDVLVEFDCHGITESICWDLKDGLYAASTLSGFFHVNPFSGRQTHHNYPEGPQSPNSEHVFWSIAHKPGEKLLASGYENLIEIWRYCPLWRNVKTFIRKPGRIRSLLFDPREHNLLYCGTDLNPSRSISLYDVHSGKQVGTQQTSHSVVSMDVIATGSSSLVAYHDGGSSVRFLDTRANSRHPQSVTHLEYYTSDVKFLSPTQLFSIGRNERFLHCSKIFHWDLRSFKYCGCTPIREYDVSSRQDATSAAVCMAFNPDGTKLAVGARGGAIGNPPYTLFLYNVISGPSLSLAKELNNDASIYSLAWHRDGEILATGSYNGEVRFWDTS